MGIEFQRVLMHSQLNSRTVGDILDTMNDKQLDLLESMLDATLNIGLGDDPDISDDTREAWKEVYETLNLEQKQVFDIYLTELAAVIDEDDEDEDEEETEENKGEEEGEDDESDNTDISEGESELGGTLYKSHMTKRYEKKVDKAGRKAEKKAAKLADAESKGKSQKKIDRLTNKANKAAAKQQKFHDRLERSRMQDKNLFEYAKKTSVGKGIAQNLIFGAGANRALMDKGTGQKRKDGSRGRRW